jgi:hypothetical protein
MNRPQEVEQSSWISDLLATLLSEATMPNFPCDEYDPEAVKVLAREWAPYSTLSEWVN